MVGRGRGAVEGVVAGEVTTDGTVGTVTGSTSVVAVLGLTVVAGASSPAGAVVVVALDEPDPEVEPDYDDPPPPDDVIAVTVAGVLPERSGTLSGGVGSGGLALVM